MSPCVGGTNPAQACVLSKRWADASLRFSQVSTQVGILMGVTRGPAQLQCQDKAGTGDGVGVEVRTPAPGCRVPTVTQKPLRRALGCHWAERTDLAWALLHKRAQHKSHKWHDCSHQHPELVRWATRIQGTEQRESSKTDKADGRRALWSIKNQWFLHLIWVSHVVCEVYLRMSVRKKKQNTVTTQHSGQ